MASSSRAAPPGPTSGSWPVMGTEIAHFLRELYLVLHNEENPDVIRWSEEGDSFIVFDSRRLVDVIGRWPEYNTWYSFSHRLVVYYGFDLTRFFPRGISKGGFEPEHYQFKHSNFLKGHPRKLRFIGWRKRPDDVTPEDHPLPPPPSDPSQSAPKQNPPNLPPNRMPGVDSLLDHIPVIKRQQEAILSELCELNKSSEYLLREHVRHEATTNRILEFLTGVLGDAAAPPVHRPDDGGPHIDIHVLRKRQRSAIADRPGGNAHSTFTHTNSPTPTPAPDQTALPAQNASYPTNSAPIPQSNPALPPNTNAANASDAIQNDAVQNIINQMMSSLQSMQGLVQALQNSYLPTQPPSSSAQQATTDHPNNRLITFFPVQWHSDLDHQDPTPKESEVVNLDLTL